MNGSNGIDGTSGSTESNRARLIGGELGRTQGMTRSRSSTTPAYQDDDVGLDDDVDPVCEEVGLDVAVHDLRGADAEKPWPEWFWVRVQAEQVPIGTRGGCSAVGPARVCIEPDAHLVASAANAILRAVTPVAELLASRVTVPVPSQSKPPAEPGPSTSGLSDDAYVDQRSELLDRQTFLRMARRGAFPSKKVGKRVLARWGDIKAALQPKTERVMPNSHSAEGKDDLDNIRKMVGLQPKHGVQ